MQLDRGSVSTRPSRARPKECIALIPAAALPNVALGALLLAFAAGLAQAGGPAASEPNPPSLAQPIDKSMDFRVGCASGGDLYFEIGIHRVRVEVDRWRVSPNPIHPPADYQENSNPVLQACKSVPLRVTALHLGGPLDREPAQWRSVRLFDIAATPDYMRYMRDDFMPHESTCRRGAHWTWCGTGISMGLATPRNEGLDAFVSLKFDLDFYRTPVGGVFFVPSGGSVVMRGNFIAFYRWDTSIAVASTGKGCTQPATGQVPVCNPSILIEGDRDVRQLVRRLLDPEPTTTRQPDKPAAARKSKTH